VVCDQEGKEREQQNPREGPSRLLWPFWGGGRRRGEQTAGPQRSIHTVPNVSICCVLPQQPFLKRAPTHFPKAPTIFSPAGTSVWRQPAPPRLGRLATGGSALSSPYSSASSLLLHRSSPSLSLLALAIEVVIARPCLCADLTERAMRRVASASR